MCFWVAIDRDALRGAHSYGQRRSNNRSEEERRQPMALGHGERMPFFILGKGDGKIVLGCNKNPCRLPWSGTGRRTGEAGTQLPTFKT
jgi:hypothetical protein